MENSRAGKGGKRRDWGRARWSARPCRDGDTSVTERGTEPGGYWGAVGREQLVKRGWGKAWPVCLRKCGWNGVRRGRAEDVRSEAMAMGGEPCPQNDHGFKFERSGKSLQDL